MFRGAVFSGDSVVVVHVVVVVVVVTLPQQAPRHCLLLQQLDQRHFLVPYPQRAVDLTLAVD